MKPSTEMEKANKMAFLELFKIREEIDSFIETLKILEDKETLGSCKKGMKDIEEGSFISLDELIEKYGLKDEI